MGGPVPALIVAWQRRGISDSRAILVGPSETTGLCLRSQLMVDKTITIPRMKLGNRIGQLDDARLAEVSQALTIFLGVG
jgi:mRNA interferase MazF